MKYFIDSSFLLALINEKDKFHDKSLDFLEIIDSNECYINNFIINEVITILGNNFGLNVASRTYNLLNSIFVVIDGSSIKDFNDKTMVCYEKYDSKLSFTDCSIIPTMINEEIDFLISFDDEFKKVEEIKLYDL